MKAWEIFGQFSNIIRSFRNPLLHLRLYDYLYHLHNISTRGPLISRSTPKIERTLKAKLISSGVSRVRSFSRFVWPTFCIICYFITSTVGQDDEDVKHCETLFIDPNFVTDHLFFLFHFLTDVTGRSYSSHVSTNPTFGLILYFLSLCFDSFIF